MAVEQRLQFADVEGDRWFAENRAQLEHWDPAGDPPLRLLAMHDLHPGAVLEVGAADGYRLAAIAERYGSACVAVEPSRQAVAAGRERHPRVKFVRATADAIPLVASSDVVIVNFVLQWVDRSRLLKTAAEIDRLLADGGHLILGDALPRRPTRGPASPPVCRNLTRFTQDYAELFVSTGLYRRVALLTTPPRDVADDGDDPAGTWLLQKDLNAGSVRAGQ